MTYSENSIERAQKALQTYINNPTTENLLAFNTIIDEYLEYVDNVFGIVEIDEILA